MKAEARLEGKAMVVYLQAETSFEEIALIEFDKRRLEGVGNWGLVCLSENNNRIETE